jgi:Caspase domain
MGTRSAEVGQGLAAVESGVGTLISFSTQPGNVALDGSGRNSPFSGALAKYVAGSNESLSDILIGVRNAVMKQTQNTQVPWEHSALTGRFYFSAGIRPAVFSGVTARGLFDAKRFQELKGLAEKYQLILPDFDIEVPSASVPTDFRRFIGVWVSEPDANSRANMLIASRVSKDGKLDGYWVFGPPAPTSRLKYSASLFPFAGTITEQSPRFESPGGNSKYRFTLTNENKLDYVLSGASESANRIFTPFWMLVEAEAKRSAGNKASQRPVPAKASPPTKAAPPAR